MTRRRRTRRPRPTLDHYSSDWITLQDAVHDLSYLLSISEHERNRFNSNAWDRVRYASRKGDLVINNEGPEERVVAREFFRWASGKRNWRTLKDVLPPREMPIEGRAAAITCGSGHLVMIPTDISELEAAYVTADRKAASLENENLRLTQRLKKCEKALSEDRARKRQRSEKTREAGKQGGRGKVK